MVWLGWMSRLLASWLCMCELNNLCAGYATNARREKVNVNACASVSVCVQCMCKFVVAVAVDTYTPRTEHAKTAKLLRQDTTGHGLTNYEIYWLKTKLKLCKI